jgi:hypothetical protein
MDSLQLGSAAGGGGGQFAGREPQAGLFDPLALLGQASPQPQ